MSKISHDENFENLVKEKIVDLCTSSECSDIIENFINDCVDIIEKKLDLKINRDGSNNVYPCLLFDISIDDYDDDYYIEQDVEQSLEVTDEFDTSVFDIDLYFSKMDRMSVFIKMSMDYSTIKIYNQHENSHTELVKLSTRLLIDNTPEKFMTIILSRIKDDIIKIMINLS